MLVCAALLVASVTAGEPASPVFALVEEFDRVAAQTFWPGFDARRTPLELYDGRDTYLVRHPAPPKEFAPVEGRPGFAVYHGRHATMRANTSVEVNGVRTATALFDRDHPLPAAVIVHECFHVFQGREHPSWTANEAALFTYPLDNAPALALSRLEMEALERALAAPHPACWAARVRALRSERFALLPKDAAGYERGTELKEGLAQYVEDAAAGKQPAFRVFGADQVRLRAYVSGEALARLLDRVSPGWNAKITDSLEGLLPDADAAGCGFTESERQAAEARARADIAQIERQRTELMEAFHGQPGWRVVVETAAGKPLLLNGFDPMNVTRLSGPAILHKRWLKLHNSSGSLEILNHGSLTEGSGAHPLFDGVRRWETAGLEVAPEVKQVGGQVTVTGASVKIEFRDAAVETSENAVVVRLR
jgi:hypothetical protein